MNLLATRGYNHEASQWFGYSASDEDAEGHTEKRAGAMETSAL